MPERFVEPSLEKVLFRTVQDIAARAYQNISVIKDIAPGEVYHSGVCEIVSEMMARELADLYGGNVHLMRFDKRGVGLHQFVRVAFGSESWVVDPTWQQFLSEPDFVKPKVLCVSQQELEKKLSENGISEAVRMMWLDATEIPVPKESSV